MIRWGSNLSGCAALFHYIISVSNRLVLTFLGNMCVKKELIEGCWSFREKDQQNT